MKKANITNGVHLSVAETRWIGERSIGHQVYQPIVVFTRTLRVMYAMVERRNIPHSCKQNEQTKIQTSMPMYRNCVDEESIPLNKAYLKI